MSGGIARISGRLMDRRDRVNGRIRFDNAIAARFSVRAGFRFCKFLGIE
jgi:hypothetical protein